MSIDCFKFILYEQNVPMSKFVVMMGEIELKLQHYTMIGS